MKRAVLVVLAVVGCDEQGPAANDAAVDESPDAPPGPIDFFGEPCSPPSSVGFVSTCRNELPYPRAYCTPGGVCRPFCNRCEARGGVEMWAFPESAARVCYCEPD